MARPVRRAAVRDIEPDDEYLPEDDSQEEEDEASRRRPARPRVRGEDDAPRTRGGEDYPGQVRRSTRTGRGGWEAVERAAAEAGDSKWLKIEENEERVLIFLDDEPFADYKLHYIPELRKGYNCISVIDEDCPLCDIGDRPKPQILFNVVDVETGAVKIWRTGVRVAQTLAAFARKPRTKPINKPGLYWAVSRSGSGTNTQYLPTPIGEEDLADYGIQPFTEDELKKLSSKRFDDSVVYYHEREDLEKVADELSR